MSICNAVAQKLSAIEPHSFSKWSFAEGTSGIAFFYSAMHSVFPNEMWDHQATRFIELSLELLKKQKRASLSLFNGLSGLNSAIFLASDWIPRAQTVLAQLDDLLISEVRRLMQGSVGGAHIYNMADGLAGVLSYLILNKNNPHLNSLRTECLEQLSQLLLNDQLWNGKEVPSWYFCKEGHVLPLTPPYGIAGPLAALSIATIEGITTPRTTQAIRHTVNWIDSLQLTGSGIHIVGGNPTPELESQLQQAKDSWISGWPGVARSLYLAGIALKDHNLAHLAQNEFLSQLSSSQRVVGPSFSVGLAGLLVLTNLMAKDTNHHQLYQKSDELEAKLIQEYNPQLPLGFTTSFDDPSLLNGAAGIAFSLLCKQKNMDCKWHRMMLL
jgi:lantibiotic modifying enzyme